MIIDHQLAFAGMLLVTFLWGSWFQTVKHIGRFPVEVYIALMYGFSVIVVWISIAFFGKELIPTSALAEISGNYRLAIEIFGCGIIFGIAMQMHLKVVKRIGLILSTSVSATCAILGGTIVTIVFAGVPEGVRVSTLIISSLILIMATIICQVSGVMKDKGNSKESEGIVKHRLNDVLLLAFINLILMSSYPVAISIGLRSSLNPAGFSSLTCMGVLVIGAFIGSAFFSINPYRRYMKDPDSTISFKKLFFLAFVASLCHFGGNVLQAICAPTVSVTIATVMGNSYHVWSYAWGIFYGEYKGAGIKTYAILAIGIVLFMVGVLMLSI